MKFCPTCQTRYDEEILRFCINDGTPLIEEKPIFTELPSESGADNLEAETVIRRNKPIILPTADFENEPKPAGETSSPRLVIPTTQPAKQENQVRTKTTESYRRQPPPRQTNTAKVVTLSILGTLIVLAGAGIVFMFLSNSNNGGQNINVNTNPNSIDTNLNTNLDINNSLFNNSNLNLNANLNSNFESGFNANFNVNLKTPTPTPTPKPSPSATPEENINVQIYNSNSLPNTNANRTNANSLTNLNTNRTNNNSLIDANANRANLNINRITPRPTLTVTPLPTLTPRQTPRPLPSVTPEE